MTVTYNNYGIIDTGYASTNQSTGTKFTQSNSGNEVLLYVSNLQFDGEANIDTTATPGKTTSGLYDIAETNCTGINNEVITLTCKYQRNNSTQMSNLLYIYGMKLTKGKKILYYTGSNYETVPHLLGSTDSYHSSNGSYVSGTTNHFHVDVKNVRITDDNGSPSGIITATITLVRTA